MNNLTIEATSFTPQIEFNAETGVLLIKGRSLPEDPAKFFDPILEWLNSYAENAQENTTLEIDLDYFNSSTSKYLFIIFKNLEKIRKNSKNVVIKWYIKHNDFEDSVESIMTYKSLIDIPFEIIEKKNL